MDPLQPFLENSAALELPETALTVLKAMFHGYLRVVIHAEFGGGFSESRILLVRPIRSSGPELPAVVKMGPVSLIKQEWRAYQECIHNRLRAVAKIDGEPVFPPACKWGGIRYPLVGGEDSQVESLHRFCLHASLDDVRYVLGRLFAQMKANWRYNVPAPDFSIQASYDLLLPVNLLVDCQETPANTASHPLTPETLSYRYHRDEAVQVSGFRVTEVERETGTITLNLPQRTLNTGLPISYRLRLRGLPDKIVYQDGKLLEAPISGRIMATREDQLRALAQRVMGNLIAVTADSFPLSSGIRLPNPLVRLPIILRQPLDVRVACLHGDLNLENVLVEHDERSRIVQLIDFASARRDHVLHDLLRLEASLVLHWLPEILASHYLRPEMIVPFYKQLHCTVLHHHNMSPPAGLEIIFAILLDLRRTARDYLFDSSNWTEYYHGLTLYLLGALKFKNLDTVVTAPSPKQLAFLGAAALQGLTLEKPPCEDIESADDDSQSGRAGNENYHPMREDVRDTAQVQTQTNFYGPVSGVIHTGSGKISTTNQHEAELSRRQQPDLAQLRELLIKHFSEGELYTLCFDLGIDYEILPGRGKGDKARELIAYCQRHDRLDDLINKCSEQRPSAKWTI